LGSRKYVFFKGSAKWGKHFADELEVFLQEHDSSTIAGVIIEPVVGSGGAIIPPEGYLERIREICTKHKIILIFDEVITGFGRVGAAFASERFNVTPDIITMAKGLTGAAVPMSAVAFHDDIYTQIISNSEEVIELFHGYTYSGHPVAAAAGIASLEVYEKEGLFERAKDLESYFEEAIHSLQGENSILDIRNIGLMAAVQFSSDDKPSTEKASKVFLHCYENNVLVRFSVDYLVLSPALIAEKQHIDKIVSTIREAIRSL